MYLKMLASKSIYSICLHACRHIQYKYVYIKLNVVIISIFGTAHSTLWSSSIFAIAQLLCIYGECTKIERRTKNVEYTAQKCTYGILLSRAMSIAISVHFNIGPVGSKLILSYLFYLWVGYFNILLDFFFTSSLYLLSVSIILLCLRSENQNVIYCVLGQCPQSNTKQ